MPDISMCDSKTCPKRIECYRNAASGTKPTPYRQAYFLWPEDHQEPCEQFVLVEERR